MLKVSDIASGLAVASLGLAILLRAFTFKSVGASPISPTFYPAVIGAVLIACGLGLIFASLNRRDVHPLVIVPGWMKRPRNVVAVLAIPVAIVAYGLASSAIGFLATSFLVMLGLLLAFRVSIVWSVTVSLVSSALLYVVFVVIMRVPLPYGVIEAFLS